MSRTSGSTSSGTPKSLAQPRVEARGAERVQLRSRGGRGVGREAGAEAVAEERVDRPHPQRPRLAALCTTSSCSSSQASLRGREVGVERQPAAALDLLLAGRRGGRAPPASACPARRRSGSSGSPLSASQASTDSPWWSSPQATISPGGVLEQLGDRLDDRLQDLLAVLLDPARLGWRLALSRRASRTGLRRCVEQRRLDAGRPLVDSEQQSVAHRACTLTGPASGLTCALPLGGDVGRAARDQPPQASLPQQPLALSDLESRARRKAVERIKNRERGGGSPAPTTRSGKTHARGGET